MSQSGSPVMSTVPYATTTPLAPKAAGGLPRLQEAGLIVVILILGIILSLPRDEIRGGSKFLRADNLIGGVATPMAVYAIMAVRPTPGVIARRGQFFRRAGLP